MKRSLILGVIDRRLLSTLEGARRAPTSKRGRRANTELRVSDRR